VLPQRVLSGGVGVEEVLSRGRDDSGAVVELPHRARGVQQRRASRRWGEWGARSRREGWGWQPSRGRGIEGAAQTPFLTGMAENGGCGHRGVARGGGGGHHRDGASKGRRRLLSWQEWWRMGGAGFEVASRAGVCEGGATVRWVWTPSL
jgi:hypothetical protein